MTQFRKLPYDRGMRISCSFSCPEEMYGAIIDFQKQERYNFSRTIQQLIRMGLVYKQLLEEQAVIEAAEKAKAPKKKKAKPKTPSK